MNEMIEIIAFLCLLVVVLSCILTAVLVYYNKAVNYAKCKQACMENCMNCRRNCVMRNKSVVIDERFKNNKAVSVMVQER